MTDQTVVSGTENGSTANNAVLAGVSRRAARQLDQWRAIHRQFGHNDLLDVVVPQERYGFAQLIAMPGDITDVALPELVNKLQSFMTVQVHGISLAEANLSHDRIGTGESYAVWCQKRVEADETHHNVSTHSLLTNDVTGMNLIERLFYGLFHQFETDHHLDVDGYTLCAGSRTASGMVPGVSWNHDKQRLDIEWFDMSYASRGVSAREVITV